MTGPYLAKPCGDCCLGGHLHEGEPRGSTEKIHDINTYVAKPSDEKSNGNIVLFFTDVYGIFHNNNLLIMDTFADAGYLCLALDFFQGDNLMNYRDENRKDLPGFDFKAWATKNMEWAMSATPKWIEAAKEKYGKEETKYACVGYCFGAPFVCQELAKDTVSAGAFAHPAFLTEKHFSDLKHPLLLSCAEDDWTFGDDQRHQAEAIMKKDKKRYMVQLFSGVKHGFALRCNLDDPYEKFVKEQSLSGMLQYFDFWLSGSADKFIKVN
ncbi:alpha/beta-hydrolase [Microthyrium microscopicum]|uniref:Alpha/beta-hydrolase n=1 Tax=Microthyrium microscopicum TaxID=703497 RepID=A0A6A6UEL7_9PEZI|nr:alpha/beta-hydrolase [Microthyrium microscopicum]